MRLACLRWQYHEYRDRMNACLDRFEHAVRERDHFLATGDQVRQNQAEMELMKHFNRAKRFAQLAVEVLGEVNFYRAATATTEEKVALRLGSGLP